MTKETTARAKAGRGYNLAYFAQKHRISLGLARALLERYADDRVALNAAARELRKT